MRIRTAARLRATSPGGAAGGERWHGHRLAVASMRSWLPDLKLALRSLAKARALSLAALASLAVGFGCAAAIFAAVNAVVLRPLPFERPGELVAIRDTFTRMNLRHINISVSELDDYRARTHAFVDVGAYAQGDANLAGERGAERVRVTYATAALFPVLGIRPALGRTFLPEEDEAGRSNVVLLSHATWRRAFGGDPSVLGRTVVLDGAPCTVVGVLPPGAAMKEEPQLWAPFGFTAEQHDPTRRGFRFLSAVARLKPGVTLAGAQADLDVLAAALRSQYPDGYPPANGWGVVLFPLEEFLLGDHRGRLLMLLGAVALLLLGACANVANLLLARSAERASEMAVRAALGASRAQLARQLLTESLLLGLAGGALGLCCAAWGLDAILALAPEGLPRLSDVRVDGLTAAVTLGLCLGTSLLFGLAPLLEAARAAPHDALKGSAGATRARNASARAVLVVAQVALALVLLAGAALMLRSFAKVSAVQPGFVADEVLVAQVGLSPASYDSPAKAQAFFAALLQRVRALPGVKSAGVASIVPTTKNSDWGFRREGREVMPAGEPSPNAEIRYVTPGYLETLRTPLVRGRLFSEADGPDAPKVVLVNQALAARYFPGEDPVGQRLRRGGEKSTEPFQTIIGVVGDMRERGLTQPAPPTFYEPFAQLPQDSGYLLVRTSGSFDALAAGLRAEVGALDPTQPVYAVEPLAGLVRRDLADLLFAAVLMGVFGAAALVLAGAGLFGVLQHAVASRTREIGIRLALGATGGWIAGWVLRRALRLTALGLGAGAAVALGLSAAVRGFVFGVPPQDPVSLGLAAAALLALALFASALPAWRAIRVHPAQSLKSE